MTVEFKSQDAVKNEVVTHRASLTVHREVEKFVLANTQEVSKDKWLCPLSGKKFKGPEFIRKHLFNKHAEKVDEVRKEVRLRDVFFFRCVLVTMNFYLYV